MYFLRAHVNISKNKNFVLEIVHFIFFKFKSFFYGIESLKVNYFKK
jgi:hypothetical protein